MNIKRFQQIMMIGLLISASELSLLACSKTDTKPSTTHSSKTTDRRNQITDIASSPYNGVAMVQAKADKFGFGTGVFISPDTLLTNRHVVVAFDNANEAILRTVNQNGQQVDLPIKSLIAPEDDSMDIGIVKLQTPITSHEELSHIKIQQIASLETTQKTKVNDFIHTVGYPGDKEYGTMWDSEGVIKDMDGNFLSYSAPITGGSSGSPLFNKDGDMIGLANASNDDMKNPTSFGFLFDTKIRDFIDQHK